MKQKHGGIFIGNDTDMDPNLVKVVRFTAIMVQIVITVTSPVLSTISTGIGALLGLVYKKRFRHDSLVDAIGFILKVLFFPLLFVVDEAIRDTD